MEGSADDQKFKERMEWLNQQYIECVKKCDTEGVKKLYVDDCIQMVPGMETMYGKDDLAKPILGLNKMGFDDIKMTTLQIGPTMGDITFERGEYEMLDKDKKVIDKGKYITMFRKKDGEWYFYLDVYNSSLPPKQ